MSWRASTSVLQRQAGAAGDGGARAVGADDDAGAEGCRERDRAIGGDAGEGCGGADGGAGGLGLGDEGGVEGGAVDHHAAEIGGVLGRAGDEGVHRGDFLQGGGFHRAGVCAEERGDELGALHRLAGLGAAVDGEDAAAGMCRGGRGRGARRTEADDEDVERLAHAAQPEVFVRPGSLPPILIEQQACSWCHLRPVSAATPRAPSAGKAMPSRPAITA